jgi:GxxExxY protein
LDIDHEGTKDTKMEGASHVPISGRVEEVAAAIVDAAIKVHRALGPGLLGSAYEACLCYELSKRGIPYRQQVALPVRYEEVFVESGIRLDILADECVIVELKSAEAIAPIHEAQLLTYLRTCFENQFYSFASLFDISPIMAM